MNRKQENQQDAGSVGEQNRTSRLKDQKQAVRG